MKTDVEKLQGAWRVVSLEIEGAKTLVLPR
jgi:hypothetical protein